MCNTGLSVACCGLCYWLIHAPIDFEALPCSFVSFAERSARQHFDSNYLQAACVFAAIFFSFNDAIRSRPERGQELAGGVAGILDLLIVVSGRFFPLPAVLRRNNYSFQNHQKRVLIVLVYSSSFVFFFVSRISFFIGLNLEASHESRKFLGKTWEG